MRFESIAEMKAYPIIHTLAINHKLKFNYQKQIGWQGGGFRSKEQYCEANDLYYDGDESDWKDTSWACEEYRIDFTVEGQFRKIGIEIDGEQFHKDVKKDNKRDVELQKHNYHVYHFPANLVLKTPHLFKEQIEKLIVEELLIRQ